MRFKLLTAPLRQAPASTAALLMLLQLASASRESSNLGTPFKTSFVLSRDYPLRRSAALALMPSIQQPEALIGDASDQEGVNYEPQLDELTRHELSFLSQEPQRFSAAERHASLNQADSLMPRAPEVVELSVEPEAVEPLTGLPAENSSAVTLEPPATSQTANPSLNTSTSTDREEREGSAVKTVKPELKADSEPTGTLANQEASGAGSNSSINQTTALPASTATPVQTTTTTTTTTAAAVTTTTASATTAAVTAATTTTTASTTVFNATLPSTTTIAPSTSTAVPKTPTTTANHPTTQQVPASGTQNHSTSAGSSSSANQQEAAVASGRAGRACEPGTRLNCNLQISIAPTLEINQDPNKTRVVNEFILSEPVDDVKQPALTFDESAFSTRNESDKSELKAEHRTLDGDEEDVELDYAIPDTTEPEVVRSSQPTATVSSLKSSQASVSELERNVSALFRNPGKGSEFKLTRIDFAPTTSSPSSTVAAAITTSSPSTTTSTTTGRTSITTTTTSTPPSTIATIATKSSRTTAAPVPTLKTTTTRTRSQPEPSSLEQSYSLVASSKSSLTPISIEGGPRRTAAGARLNQKILRLPELSDLEPARISSTSRPPVKRVTTESPTRSNEKYRQFFSEPVGSDSRRRHHKFASFGADEEEMRILTKYPILSQLSRLSSANPVERADSFATGAKARISRLISTVSPELQSSVQRRQAPVAGSTQSRSPGSPEKVEEKANISGSASSSPATTTTTTTSTPASTSTQSPSSSSPAETSTAVVAPISSTAATSRSKNLTSQDLQEHFSLIAQLIQSARSEKQKADKVALIHVDSGDVKELDLAARAQAGLPKDSSPNGQPTSDLEESLEEQLLQNAHMHQRTTKSPAKADSLKRRTNTYTKQPAKYRPTSSSGRPDSTPQHDNGKWHGDHNDSGFAEEESMNDLLPGRPGIDYPIHWQVPRTSFDCRNYQVSGFYADIESDCQAYHSCHKGRGGRHTFLCPNGTLFSQELLTCDWWYNVECSTSRLYLSTESGLEPSLMSADEN